MIQQLETDSENMERVYTEKFSKEIQRSKAKLDQYTLVWEKLSEVSPSKVYKKKRTIGNLSVKTQAELNQDTLSDKIKSLKKEVAKKVSLYHYFVRLMQDEMKTQIKIDRKSTLTTYKREFRENKTNFFQELTTTPSPTIYPFPQSNNIDSNKISLGAFEESLGSFPTYQKHGLSNRVESLLRQSTDLRDLLKKKHPKAPTPAHGHKA